MITRAERLRAREEMYLYALGPLGLRREELWTVTNGELMDMIEARQYRVWLDRREQAIHTAAIMNMWAKRRISPQDIAGIWKRGRVLGKTQFIQEWKEERRKRREAE